VLCHHERKTQARNVTAVIHPNGHLTSGESPIHYDRLVFCSNPVCEKVFVAEREGQPRTPPKHPRRDAAAKVAALVGV